MPSFSQVEKRHAVMVCEFQLSLGVGLFAPIMKPPGRPKLITQRVHLIRKKASVSQVNSVNSVLKLPCSKQKTLATPRQP